MRLFSGEVPEKYSDGEIGFRVNFQMSVRTDEDLKLYMRLEDWGIGSNWEE